jgi:AcrR family transcriptional regulator
MLVLGPPSGEHLPLHGRRLSARQQEVLDALEHTFLDRGLDVTVAELVAEAHCSRRTLYELAPTKEELFLLVIDRMMRRVGKTARDAAAAQTTPEARMEAFMGAGVTGWAPFTPAFRAAIESYGPAGWLLNHHLALARDYVVETIEDGIAEGRFRDAHPGLVADGLMAAVRRVTEPQLLQANGLTTAAALEELFRVFVHGLVARDDAAVTRSPGRSPRGRARSADAPR